MPTKVIYCTIDSVLKAVEQDGLALQYANEELKKDREVVLEVVKQSGWALRCASEELKKDYDFIKEAASSIKHILYPKHEDNPTLISFIAINDTSALAEKLSERRNFNSSHISIMDSIPITGLQRLQNKNVAGLLLDSRFPIVSGSIDWGSDGVEAKYLDPRSQNITNIRQVRADAFYAVKKNEKEYCR